MSRRLVTRELRIALSTVATLLFTSLLPVQAHLVTTGLGPVYDGIGHFVLSPETWVPALALALLAGLRGTAAGRQSLLVLPLAWLIGGLIGLRFEGPSTNFIPALSCLALGILVAADCRMPLWTVMLTATTLGLLHGFLDGAAVGTRGLADGVLELLGIGATLFVLVALVAAFVTSLRTLWTRIAVRVAGSWIAAMGLLLLGWTLRRTG